MVGRVPGPRPRTGGSSSPTADGASKPSVAAASTARIRDARPPADPARDDSVALVIRSRHGVYGDHLRAGDFIRSFPNAPSAAGLSGAAWCVSGDWLSALDGVFPFAAAASG